MKKLCWLLAVTTFALTITLTGCGGSSSGSGDSLEGVKVIGILDGPLADNIQNSTELDHHSGETMIGPLLIPGSEVEFLDDSQKAYIKTCFDAHYPILFLEINNIQVALAYEFLETGMVFNDNKEEKFLWCGFEKIDEGDVEVVIGYYPDEMVTINPCPDGNCLDPTTNSTFREMLEEAAAEGNPIQIPENMNEHVKTYDYTEDIQQTNVNDINTWMAGMAAKKKAKKEATKVVKETTEMQELSEIADECKITTLFTGAEGKKYQIITSVSACREYSSGEAYYLFDQKLSLNNAPGYDHRRWCYLLFNYDEYYSVPHSFDINTYPVTATGETADDVHVHRLSPGGSVSTVSFSDSFSFSLGGSIAINNKGISASVSTGISMSKSVSYDVPEMSVSSYALDNPEANQLRWVYQFPLLEADGDSICSKFGEIRNVHKSTTQYEQAWIWSAPRDSKFTGTINIDVAAKSYEPAQMYSANVLGCAWGIYANYLTTEHNATITVEAPPKIIQ